MRRDDERVGRVQQALRRARCDALLCAVPKNVLMLSGYWPVTGTSVAIVTAAGAVQLVVPSDEEELAGGGYADRVATFEPASLKDLRTMAEAVGKGLKGVLGKLLGKAGLKSGRIALERRGEQSPASYVSVYRYGNLIEAALRQAGFGGKTADGQAMLTQLAMVKTAGEVERVRAACKGAAEAYQKGLGAVRAGRTELDVAAEITAAHSAGAGEQRRNGAFYCMSGPNAAKAYAAYQMSRQRQLRRGDLVLLHANTAADGYWTDITRTYVLGEPTAKQRKWYSAVLEASQAAMEAVRPGATGRQIDAAARRVIKAHGFGDDFFKHPTGHAVGFTAIDHDAPPRLHPKSDDRLETGAVFNIEPALYQDGYGGLRHCQIFAVTPHGADLLTPFHSRLEDLVLPA